MNSIEIRPEARAEMHQAFAWYEELQPGLGLQFLYAVDAVIERIRRRPRSYSSIDGEVRRALVRRFPYAIIFKAEGGLITVFAVYHGRRRPHGWTDRVTEPDLVYSSASDKRMHLAALAASEL